MKDQGYQTYGPWAKTGPTSGFNPARLMILKFKKYINTLFRICLEKKYFY